MLMKCFQQKQIVKINCSTLEIIELKTIKMKLKTIILSLSFLSLMLFNTTVFAQDSSFSLIQKELTEQQRNLLQKNIQLNNIFH